MTSILNERLLQRRYFLATTLTVTGLLLLLLSSLLLFVFPSSAITLPLLPLGSIAAIVGLRITNAWLRTPAPHVAIDDALKGLTKTATIFHYHAPARHLLLSEHGIFSITAYPHPFTLNITDDQWSTEDRLLTALQISLTYPAVGNPLQTAQRDADQARAWLSDRVPGTDITVTPVITLTSPNATLSILGEQTVHITTTTKNRYPLKALIRQHSNPTLSQDQMALLLDTLK